MKLDELDRFARTPFAAGWSSTERVFFSPVDDVHGVLLAVLAAATHRVSVNMYGYDDDELDAALHAKAASPSIAFVMNLDRSQAGGVHEKALVAPWANAIGSSIAIGESVRHAISHLKVAVIDGLYIVSGSTNWSASGESKQDNELTVSADPLKAARFESIILTNHLQMLKQMKGAPP